MNLRTISVLAISMLVTPIVAMAEPARLTDLNRERATLTAELKDATEDRDKAAAMMKTAKEKNYLSALSVADEARMTAQKRIDDANEKLRAVNDRISSEPKGTGSAPRNLAKEKDIPLLMTERLRIVRDRIARLQKAKSVLSYRDNPEWEKNWNALMTDFRRDNAALTEASIDGLTSILMMGYQASLAKGASKPDGFSGAEQQRLRTAEERLKKIVTREDVFGAASEKLKALMATLKSTDADDFQKRARVMGQARDTVFALGSGAERRTEHLEEKDRNAMLLEATQSIGDIAVIYVQHSPLVDEVKDRAGIILKGAEADALQFMALQDDVRLDAAADRSAERQRKFRELDATIGQLQTEERTLTEEIKRATPK